MPANSKKLKFCGTIFHPSPSPNTRDSFHIKILSVSGLKINYQPPKLLNAVLPRRIQQ